MDYIKYTAKLDLTDNGALNTGWRIKQGDNGKVLIVIKVVNNNDVHFISFDDIDYKMHNREKVIIFCHDLISSFIFYV